MPADLAMTPTVTETDRTIAVMPSHKAIHAAMLNAGKFAAPRLPHGRAQMVR